MNHVSATVLLPHEIGISIDSQLKEESFHGELPIALPLVTESRKPVHFPQGSVSDRPVATTLNELQKNGKLSINDLGVTHKETLASKR